jgi:hypothetical protein
LGKVTAARHCGDDVVAGAASAQVVGGNTKPGGEQTYTMSVTSKLVIEAVNVKDKQGKSITGLTAKDFTITEDGVAQKVSFAEYQELPDGSRCAGCEDSAEGERDRL